MQVRRSSFQEEQPCESKDGKPAGGNGNAVSEPAAEDNIETSVFYQSVMSWKNLQEWAQRVWAKHYQQSPGGSTQNVKPVIFQGGLGVEFIPSAAENSPSDQNASPTSEHDANFGYHDNLQPANQHTAVVSQNSAAARQSETSNVVAQPANRSSVVANQNEVSNFTAGRGSGYICCQGDAVNKLNLRNQLDVQSPIERDLQAAARHRERLGMQTRLEQTTKNSKKSRCMLFTQMFYCYLLNNNDKYDNVCGAVIVAKTTARVHPVRLMNMELRQAAADPQPRPNDPGCESTCRLPIVTGR